MVPEVPAGPSDELAGLLTDLSRWTAEARAEEAARSRAKESWLHRQAAEEATWAALVLDLAEQAAPVVVQSIHGRSHQGRLAAVGADFLLLAATDPSAANRATFLPTQAIALLRPGLGVRWAPSAGDRQAGGQGVRLADVLAGVAADRPRVIIGTGAAGTITGELVWAGVDLAGVRLDSEPPAVVAVRISALSELTLLG